jgi:hypothetical protein
MSSSFSEPIRPRTDPTSTILSWISLSILGLLFIWTLWYAILPAKPLGVFVVVLLWFVAGAVWLLALFTRFISLWKLQQRISPAECLCWSIMPMVGILSVVLLFSSLGYRLGFALSRPAMDRLMQQSLSSPEHPPTVTGWIGLYRIQRVSCSRMGPDGLSAPNGSWSCSIFLQDADEGHGGFYYVGPSPLKKPFSGDTDLGNGWYAWRHWPT